MNKLNLSVKDALVAADHVEETSEGLLKGGFAIIGGDEDDGISPLSNYGICFNFTDCDCGKPTSKNTSNGIVDFPSLSF